LSGVLGKNSELFVYIVKLRKHATNIVKDLASRKERAFNFEL
jgi:hypothetical protein